jgi:hypothetical protein
MTDDKPKQKKLPLFMRRMTRVLSLNKTSSFGPTEPPPTECPRRGQLPHRPSTSDCRSPRKSLKRLPRIIVPVITTHLDEIDRAMQKYSECDPEESPTWTSGSPTSTALAASKERGAESLRDEYRMGITMGTHRATDHACIWTVEAVIGVPKWLCLYEGRRRVRKWYARLAAEIEGQHGPEANAKHDALQEAKDESTRRVLALLKLIQDAN